MVWVMYVALSRKKIERYNIGWLFILYINSACVRDYDLLSSGLRVFVQKILFTRDDCVYKLPYEVSFESKYT